MICPNCRQEVLAGERVCGNCGKRLPVQEPLSLEMTGGTDEFRARQAALEQILNGTADVSIPELAGMQSPEECMEALVYEKAEGCQEESEVDIEYAVNRFVLSGGNVNFELRVKGRQGDLKSVSAWLVFNFADQREVREMTREWRQAKGCFSNILPYTFMHSITGSLLVDGYVMCDFGEKKEFFTFSVQHAVIPGGEKAQSINTTIRVDGSSVMKDIDLGGIAANDGSCFFSRQNLQPPEFRRIAFYRTDWRPENELLRASSSCNAYSCDALTLTYGEKLIHLCAKNSIDVGRSLKQNDVAINDWTSRESFNAPRSLSVSHKHGVFTYCGDGVDYADCSRYGTLLDSKTDRITISRNDGCCDRVRLPGTGTISFGGIAMSFRQTCCAGKRKDAMCATCEGNPCCALVLHRTDKLPEAFVFLWQCCDLRELFPELAGMKVYRRNGSFMLETKEHGLQVLYPGQSIDLSDGRHLEVDSFFQPGY